MDTRIRATYVAALLVSGLGLLAVLAVQGILDPASYAAVAMVLVALALIVQRIYANGYAARTLAQLLSPSDAAITQSRDFRWRM